MSRPTVSWHAPCLSTLLESFFTRGLQTTSMMCLMRTVIRLAAFVALFAGVAAAAPLEFPLAGLAPAQAAPVRAPDFRLPRLGGGTISLSTFKGQPVILVFWAPW